MGNLSVDTWRTIYDTLKKQRGTQDAADTPLGQMFALLDGYEATLRQSEAENSKLRAAISWIAPPFVDEKTPEAELRQRIAFAVADLNRAAFGGDT